MSYRSWDGNISNSSDNATSRSHDSNALNEVHQQSWQSNLFQTQDTAAGHLPGISIGSGGSGDQNSSWMKNSAPFLFGSNSGGSYETPSGPLGRLYGALETDAGILQKLTTELTAVEQSMQPASMTQPSETLPSASPPAETLPASVPPAETQSAPPAEAQTQSAPPAEAQTQSAPPAEAQTQSAPPAEAQTQSAPPASTQPQTLPPPEAQPQGTTPVAVSSITPPSPSGLGSITGISATVNGFSNTGNGDALNIVGVNASPEDAVAGFANVQKDFPGLTAVRLNVDPSNTSDPDIAQAIREYTGAGIAVELEVHDTNGNGSGFDSTYEQWANDYKNNPLVMLETPNEPSGSTVASDQAQYIEEIRAQGFTNPIGIQPVGGYDESNIPTVLQDLQNDNQSTANLYVTPHIYYGGTDANGAMSWAQGEVSGAQQNGLPALIDEYGPAMDGYTMDPQGETVNAAMYTLNQNGYGTQKQVGSIYWGMDNGNHTNGADSAFLTPDGSQLTSDGQLLQQTILAGQ